MVLDNAYHTLAHVTSGMGGTDRSKAMSADKEKKRIRIAREERVVETQLQVFKAFGMLGDSRKPGYYRKHKAFACSCAMCRRMDFQTHRTRHKTPNETRAMDSYKAQVAEYV